ncbi:hypothetical protein CEUSTIGMA_g2303.t1 [Chlamydomonas eustigma]|uniref:Uncharacterized protein n=1 Tax=Chlamydomonas eustigma TaxID=1157962 RepID=A0A250WVK0_9CHLO|nr:hypothetical protein CEUSTIGMA_g2303.t1 [Chlamydomonas eustigma]|eukprot:GAX74857.1 hypothetical protein CEUSTIGMA_g2303.t1 [Chlamydomonas eustigma]
MKTQTRLLPFSSSQVSTLPRQYWQHRFLLAPLISHPLLAIQRKDALGCIWVTQAMSRTPNGDHKLIAGDPSSFQGAVHQILESEEGDDTSELLNEASQSRPLLSRSTMESSVSETSYAAAPRSVEQAKFLKNVVGSSVSTDASDIEKSWLANQSRALHLTGQGAALAAFVVGIGFWVRWFMIKASERASKDSEDREGDKTSDDVVALGDRRDGGDILPAKRSAKKVDPIGDPFLPFKAFSGRSAPTVDSKATEQDQLASSGGSLIGPAKASPQRDPYWWKTLSKIHYINFGAQYGLLPCIPIERLALGLPPRPSLNGIASPMTCLVAFEDMADAEYVAATLRFNMEQEVRQKGAVVPTGTVKINENAVLSTTPMFLDDLAQLQGAKLAVIPGDQLSRSARLTDEALKLLLTSCIISGKTSIIEPDPDNASTTSPSNSVLQASPRMKMGSSLILEGKVRPSRKAQASLSTALQNLSGRQELGSLTAASTAGSQNKSLTGPRQVSLDNIKFEFSKFKQGTHANVDTTADSDPTIPADETQHLIKLSTDQINVSISNPTEAAGSANDVDTKSNLVEVTKLVDNKISGLENRNSLEDSSSSGGSIVESEFDSRDISSTTSSTLNVSSKSRTQLAQESSAAISSPVPEETAAAAAPESDTDQLLAEYRELLRQMNLEDAKARRFQAEEQEKRRKQRIPGATMSELSLQEQLEAELERAAPMEKLLGRFMDDKEKQTGSEMGDIVEGRDRSASTSAQGAQSGMRREQSLTNQSPEQKESAGKPVESSSDKASKAEIFEVKEDELEAGERDQLLSQWYSLFAPSSAQAPSSTAAGEPSIVSPSTSSANFAVGTSGNSRGGDLKISYTTATSKSDHPRAPPASPKPLRSSVGATASSPAAAAAAAAARRSSTSQPTTAQAVASAQKSRRVNKGITAAPLSSVLEQSKAETTGIISPKSAGFPATSSATSSTTTASSRISDQATISQEEEEAYVSAVMKNLEIVTQKVKAAEMKMARAAALAKSGDAAAAAAKRAAEAQLAPLREQLAQLKELQDSLIELSRQGSTTSTTSKSTREAGTASSSSSSISWSGEVLPTEIISEAPGSTSSDPYQVRSAETSVHLETLASDSAQAKSTSQRPGVVTPSSLPIPNSYSLPKPAALTPAPTATIKRTWGAWSSRNQRIRDADVALIKKSAAARQQEHQPEYHGQGGGSSGGSSSGGSSVSKVITAFSIEPMKPMKAPRLPDRNVNSLTSSPALDILQADQVVSEAQDIGSQVRSQEADLRVASGSASGTETLVSRTTTVSTNHRESRDGYGSSSDDTSWSARMQQQGVLKMTAQHREDDERVEIVSMKSGVKRRISKRERTPEERHATVKEAMRFAAAGMGGGVQGAGSEGTRSASTPWWRQRYQALWLPNLRYSDESMGFVQLDVSLNQDVKDMRVLAFEDRHDAIHCMAVLKQWPEYDWCDMSVNMLPTQTIEEDIRGAFHFQEQGSEKVSPPDGIVVFRKGKLPLKVGMSMEEFTQIVVYQAAAQFSLSKVGYGFDDF